MPRGRPPKKPRLSKYDSQNEDIQYLRHHIYRANESGRITVQSGFMAENLVKKNEPPPSLDIVDDGFQDVQWDPSNDTLMDDGHEDQPTGRKQYPSVCGV